MANPETSDVVFQPAHCMPERTHEEPSRALFAAWQNCAINQHNPHGDRTFQQEHLQAITSNACAGQIDEYTRASIEQGSAVLAYLWFGSDHTPLPQGLRRFGLPDDDAPVLALNPYTPGRVHLKVVMQHLHNAGLGRLITHRQKLYHEQAGCIFGPLARALVANTPGYRLLESFNTVQHTWEERPLTPVEHLVEGQMAEMRIRRRHGLTEQDPLFANPAAQYELSRAKHRLDLATRYDYRDLPEKPPRERARRFFTQLIVNDNSVRGKRLQNIQTIELGLPLNAIYKLLSVTTDTESLQINGESVANFAESQGFLSTPSMYRAQAISSGLVSNMVLHLFDKSQDGRDYGELLEELLDHHTTSLMRDMGELASGSLDWNRFHALATLLTAPTEIDEQLNGIALRLTPFPDIAPANHVVSRKEYREAQRQIFGRIQKRPPENDMRIMQYGPLDISLAVLDENTADMVLHLPKLSETLMPHIPGYQPVGYNAEQHLFGLRYTPEADPYTECLTRIPDGSRQTLAAAYADLGLNELALLVHDAKDLTVGQLARLVSQTNRYTLPSQAAPIDIPDTLAGYTGRAKDGQLDMQCIDSSHVLRLSLQEVFSRDVAGIIGGSAIPRKGRRITAAGHQQTTFIDPQTNHLYILDATPSRVPTATLQDMLLRHMNRLRQGLGRSVLQPERSAPRQQYPASTPEQSPEAATAEYRHNLITQTKDALILQLRMIYGQGGQPMTQDRMLDHVASLRGDDIIFRSLSAAILASQGRLARVEAEQLAQYIETLRNCDNVALLRQVDPRGYTGQPRLLGALHTHISQLARLVD